MTSAAVHSANDARSTANRLARYARTRGIPTTAATPAKDSKAKSDKLSALDAAAKVLGEKKEPMNSKEMVTAMEAKGYWKSPGGKTPHATLYSAILREITTKGSDARFKKTQRGKFTSNT